MATLVSSEPVSLAMSEASPGALVPDPVAGEPPPLHPLRVALVSIDGSCYATAVKQLREVVRYPDTIARAPGAELWLRGVTNLHGRVMAVIDLQACLGGANTPIGGAARLLVMEYDGHLYGFTVSSLDPVDEPLPAMSPPLRSLVESTTVGSDRRGLNGYLNGHALAVVEIDGRQTTVVDLLSVLRICVLGEDPRLRINSPPGLPASESL